MSDPTQPLATALEPEHPHPVWIVQPPRRRLGVHILLLFATFATTLVVGARIQFNFAHHQPVFSLSDDSPALFPLSWIAHPSELLPGIPFSVTLMFILLAHEMGHYLFARRYGVYVTLPFFIPFPSLIGTLGAFIRIKSPIPSRAALFDIGIAGPIAGFIPACVAVWAGLTLSHPLVSHGVPIERELGFPLIFHVVARVLHLAAPLASLSLHPIAVAGWVGMFATALNLLPAGQLDGGHILFSVFPRLHRLVSLLAILTLIPLAKYCWVGWLLWSVLLWVTSQHPPVPAGQGVSAARRWIAVFGVAILVLSFTPAPFTQGSGRDIWQQYGPGVRGGIRHVLHRK